MGRGGRGRGREVLGRCDGCEEKGEGGLVRTCRMSRGRSAELREGGSETAWAGSSSLSATLKRAKILSERDGLGRWSLSRMPSTLNGANRWQALA